MKKISKILKSHFNGNVTKESKKIIQKISSRLEMSGFKPPFKMKLASRKIIFNTNLTDEIETEVTAIVSISKGLPATRIDPEEPSHMEEFELIYADSKQEVPYKVIQEEIERNPDFEYNLEQKAFERADEDYDKDFYYDEY